MPGPQVFQGSDDPSEPLYRRLEQPSLVRVLEAWPMLRPMLIARPDRVFEAAAHYVLVRSERQTRRFPATPGAVVIWMPEEYGVRWLSKCLELSCAGGRLRVDAPNGLWLNGEARMDRGGLGCPTS